MASRAAKNVQPLTLNYYTMRLETLQKFQLSIIINQKRHSQQTHNSNKLFHSKYEVIKRC